jgi:heavy metal sensor kinase
VLTIKAKIIIAYTLVFGLLIAGFSFAVYRGVRDARMAKLDAKLENHAGKLLAEIEEDYDENWSPETAELLTVPPEGLSEIHLQLILPSGQSLLTDSLLQRATKNPWREAFQGVLQRQSLMIGGRHYRALWQPVEIDEHIPYVLEIATSTHDVTEDLERLRLLLLIAIPGALLLTGLAASWITKAALRPISSMTETARTITANNLEARLDLPRAQDEVRRLGETLNDLMERLDSAFKSQKQFVADASHEIRTPLSIVRTELEYALRQASEPAVKESIQTSLSEIDRLTRMTAQLLLLARLDADSANLNLQTVRLDELLIECVQLSNSWAAKKGARVDVFVEEAVELRADGEKLKSVMLNILDNAIKFSPKGSKIACSLRTSRSKGTAELAVEDHGPGIPPEDIPKIFERFYQADAVRGEGSGSGLGLAIARRIVELHKGTLSVKSRIGTGTCFTVELPVKPGG